MGSLIWYVCFAKTFNIQSLSTHLFIKQTKEICCTKVSGELLSGNPKTKKKKAKGLRGHGYVK